MASAVMGRGLAALGLCLIATCPATRARAEDAAPSAPDAGAARPASEASPPSKLRPPRLIFVTELAGKVLGFRKGYRYDGPTEKLRSPRSGSETPYGLADLGSLPERPAYTLVTEEGKTCVARGIRMVYVDGVITPKRFRGMLAVELEGCHAEREGSYGYYDNFAYTFGVLGEHPRLKAQEATKLDLRRDKALRESLEETLKSAGVAPVGEKRRYELTRFKGTDLSALAAIGPMPCCGTAVVDLYLMRGSKVVKHYEGLGWAMLQVEYYVVGGRPLMLVRDYHGLKILSTVTKVPTELLVGRWPIPTVDE